MNFKISVIIPTYNRADTLDRALASVFSQSMPAHEVILVDDGSTDATRSQVASCYPQLVYIRQDNAGVSAARNRGIRRATGNWLAFLDSDDYWLTDKLLKQCAALQQQPQYLICHSDEIWMRHGRRVNPGKRHAKTGGYIFEHCLPMCRISPSSVLIQQTVFDDVGLFDETLPACEDYDFWLRICAHYPVLYLHEHLIVKHGGHTDQLSKRYWGMDRFRIQSMLNLLASKKLNRRQQQAVREQLLSKIDIFLTGSYKRNQVDRIHYYEKLREQLAAMNYP